MTEKELSRYYWLKKEVNDLEDRIKEFGDGLGAIKYNESIKGIGGKLATIQDKYMQLRDMYMEKRVSALEEYIKIENYISKVDDPEIRGMMRMRYMNLKDWEQIGKEYHCERTTASKKVRNYIKNQLSHNSHENMR